MCRNVDLATQVHNAFLSQDKALPSPQPACEVLASRQAEFSELILDVAWLLKKRFNCLFNILMEKESTVILEGLYCSLKSSIDNDLVDGDSDSDVRLLQKIMDTERRRLAPKSHETVLSKVPAPSGTSVIPATNQGLQRTLKNMLGLGGPSSSLPEDGTVPLLKDELIMNINLLERPRMSCSRSLSRTLSTSLLLIMAVIAVARWVCFGVCAVVLHPQWVGPDYVDHT